VLYDYQPSRSGKHPADFLRDFNGFLHTDGYAEYHRKLPDRIAVVGCWAHCRKKFDEALMALGEKDRANSESLRGKRLCDRVFELERKFSGLPPDNNFEAWRLARVEQSKPVMESFFSWIEKMDKEALPKMLLGQAVRYALDQRIWLERVLLDGRFGVVQQSRRAQHQTFCDRQEELAVQ